MLSMSIPTAVVKQSWQSNKILWSTVKAYRTNSRLARDASLFIVIYILSFCNKHSWCNVLPRDPPYTVVAGDHLRLEEGPDEISQIVREGNNFEHELFNSLVPFTIMTWLYFACPSPWLSQRTFNPSAHPQGPIITIGSQVSLLVGVTPCLI